MTEVPEVIDAAGGVLVRRDGGRVEVAVVHRPRYDDWTLPKGKALPGEHAVLCAAREAREETAYDIAVRRPLGEVRYVKDGRPKRVRYWVMEATGGAFVPGHEVDRLAWLDVAAATRRLDRDVEVVARFAEEPAATVPVLLIRGASAAGREAWEGPDRERPLDEAGTRQAGVWAALLGTYGVRRLVSADVRCCVETVAGHAVSGVVVETDPLLSERGFDTAPGVALDRAIAAVASGTPAALCGEGGVLRWLATSLADAFAVAVPGEPELREGAAWVLHVAPGDRPRVVAVERVEV